MEEEEEDEGWAQESMLRVLRVEHLPTAMDGDFDAMVSIHQRKWEEDWEHPLGGKWVGNEKRLGRTETKQTHPAKDPTVVFSTTTPGDTISLSPLASLR